MKENADSGAVSKRGSKRRVVVGFAEGTTVLGKTFLLRKRGRSSAKKRFRLGA